MAEVTEAKEEEVLDAILTINFPWRNGVSSPNRIGCKFMICMVISRKIIFSIH